MPGLRNKDALKQKVFRDNVHGYIHIPNIIVREIVDTEVFQRLKHIEQTSMRPLFPAARHDRFIHSLGVYHLGCRAFDALRREAPDDLAQGSDDVAKDRWWKRWRLLFTLACLLHDCAHAPFSHTLEKYYDLTPHEGGKGWNLNQELLRVLQQDDRYFSADGATNGKLVGAPHERMSSLVLATYFRKNLERVFAAYRSRHLIDGELTGADLAFMVRAIIGCRYRQSNEPMASFKNCLIGLLNSSTLFDVDGLDYAVRDTYNSGLSNWSVDYDRIFEGLRLMRGVLLPEGSILVDSTQCVVWERGATFDTNPESVGMGQMTIYGRFIARFEEANDAREAFKQWKSQNGDPVVSMIPVRDGESHTVCVGNDGAKCTLPSVKYHIDLSSSCKVDMSSWSGTVCGAALSSTRLDGYRTSTQNPDSLTYFVAFNKNSISSMEGALEARNTFYRWVYSHPMVQYYSTFLQNYLFKLSSKYLCCRYHEKGNRPIPGCPPEHCDGKACPYADNSTDEPSNDSMGVVSEEDVSIELLGIQGFLSARYDKQHVGALVGIPLSITNDDDLNALFKWVYLDNKLRGENRSKRIDRFFGEYFARPKKRPLWKSYEEWEHLSQTTDNWPSVSYDNLPGSETSLASLDFVFVNYDAVDEATRAIVECFDPDKTHDLLLIKVSTKTKAVSTDSVYVSFGEGIERLADVVGGITNVPWTKSFYFLYGDEVASDV